MLPSSCLTEKSAEGFHFHTPFTCDKVAIGLNPVLQTEELPACISELDSRLSDMNTDNFSHFKFSLVLWFFFSFKISSNKTKKHNQKKELEQIAKRSDRLLRAMKKKPKGGDAGSYEEEEEARASSICSVA